MPQPVVVQTAVLFGLASHLVPQARQFCVSSSRTQAPLHGLKPSSHWMPQPLAPHMGEPLATEGQAVSQLVQWAGSAAISTQEPPQFVVPLGQSLTHLPAAQA